jgi:hypothetical protein
VLLSLAVMAILVGAVIAMSYLSVKVLDSARSGTVYRKRVTSLLITLSWFAALSLCSVPLVFFAISPVRESGIILSETLAAFIAILIGASFHRALMRGLDDDEGSSRRA